MISVYLLLDYFVKSILSFNVFNVVYRNVGLLMIKALCIWSIEHNRSS